jgi:hypothetical protein
LLWLQQQKLPGLADNSEVVLDNAAFRSVQGNKRPISATLKKRYCGLARKNGQ